MKSTEIFPYQSLPTSLHHTNLYINPYRRSNAKTLFNSAQRAHISPHLTIHIYINTPSGIRARYLLQYLLL